MSQSYSTTFIVDQTPAEAFAAINNVRGWWSEEVEGNTDTLGAEWNYHYKDVHICKFKIAEFVPNEKVVWHVVDNYFNFVKDKTEWTGTDVVFEIVPKGDQSEIRFTHVGLVPAYECYEVCSNAWGTYVTHSLRDLITTGKGQPNPIEEIVSQARQMSGKDFTTSLIVDQSPEVVFDAINNVRGWWTGDIEGRAEKLDDEFSYRHEDIHFSKQKVTEFVPNKKVVWHVIDSQINFVEDKTEWTDTDIVFEISTRDGVTELRFTHVGLVTSIECYGNCSDAWGFYINNSLYRLITTGQGHPSVTEKVNEEKTTS